MTTLSRFLDCASPFDWFDKLTTGKLRAGSARNDTGGPAKNNKLQTIEESAAIA
jgi:hypothetical protein